MGRLIGETVTVVSPDVTEGRNGARVLDWSDPTETTVDNVAVAPRTTSEDNDGRNAVTVGLTLLMPATATVAPEDRIVVRGDTYEADGEPGEWVSPYSAWAPGLELAVKRVDG